MTVRFMRIADRDRVQAFCECDVVGCSAVEEVDPTAHLKALTESGRAFLSNVEYAGADLPGLPVGWRAGGGGAHYCDEHRDLISSTDASRGQEADDLDRLEAAGWI